VLSAAGIAVDLDPERATRQIEDPDVGWAYVDQSMYCPPLHALVQLREHIVKRPCLTTIESVVPPIRGRGRLHLLTGYVHKAYPHIYLDLARHARYHSALVVRGVEGGVVASLTQPSRAWRLEGSAEDEFRLDPLAAGIEAGDRAVPWPADVADASPDTRAQAAAAAIEAALAGSPGPARESLTYGAAAVVLHLGRAHEPAAAAALARSVLDDGGARRRYERARM
jgi:anthranilate phosphoribosyltransferase